jgi:hypothetical protein
MESFLFFFITPGDPFTLGYSDRCILEVATASNALILLLHDGLVFSHLRVLR